MKKITLMSLVFLCIFSAVLFQPCTRAQAGSEADKVLQLLNESGTNQPNTVDPQKDYVSEKIKEGKRKSVEKNDGAKLEFGPLKENIVNNDFLFAVYNAKFNGEKGYILLAFLRDKDTKTTWHLMQRYILARKDSGIIVIETKLFGTDPEERQKYIEAITRRYTEDLNKTRTQTKSPPK